VGKALDFLLPWDSQPQEVVDVNPDYTFGLLWSGVAGNNAIFPSAGPVTLYDTGSDSWGVGRLGRDRTVATTAGGLGVPSATDIGAVFTAVIAYEVTSAIAGTRVLLAGKTNFNQVNGFMVYKSGANTLGFNGGDGSGFPTITSTDLFAVGASGLLVLVFNGTAVTAYRNGALLGSVTLTSQAGATASGIGIGAYIGGANTGGASGVKLSCAGIVKGVANSLIANPWQLFAPQTIPVPVSAAGGGASTITGNLGTATASGFTATVNANRTIAGALGTAAASGFTGTVNANTTIAGGLGTATASGLQGTVNANTTIAGALGTATAEGFQGTISNSSDTTINGSLGTAVASGLTGNVNANRTIAGSLGTATASGFQGTVSNTNDVVINGNLGTATASGFAGNVNANTTIAGGLGVAVAEGLSGSVQNGAPPEPVIVTGGGGWLPMPRRRTRKEIDDERRALGILPPEVVAAAAAIPKPQRQKITMAQLVGRTTAKEVSRFDLEAAITAHKKRRQRMEDELLLLM
jgi:hypothetical protein